MKTKDAILIESLKLFAREGYEAVSVREIAQKLGLTQGALYKHFANKRAIFDAIVAQMQTNDADRAREFETPEGTLLETPDAYKNVAFASVRRFSEECFRYWTEDEFASNFRKMLTLEQFRSPELAELYQNYLSGGPLRYLADVFWEAMKNGSVRQDSPQALALEFYSPIYALYNLFDVAKNIEEKAKIKRDLTSSLDRFESRYILSNERSGTKRKKAGENTKNTKSKTKN